MKCVIYRINNDDLFSNRIEDGFFSILLATINMVAYQGASASKRIFSVIDKPILIKAYNSIKT